MNKYILFVGIGFELIGLIIGALVLSAWLEEKYPSKGTLTAGLVLLALIGWFIHIFILLKNIENQGKKGN